jgi:hypothetical protein
LATEARTKSESNFMGAYTPVKQFVSSKPLEIPWRAIWEQLSGTGIVDMKDWRPCAETSITEQSKHFSVRFIKRSFCSFVGLFKSEL